MMKRDDYKIGYGKPPKHSQFKPGQSGNPNGRPRKSKSMSDLIEQELNRTIQINEGGKLRRVTKRETIAIRLVNEAVSKDLRAFDRLLKLLDKAPASEPFRVTDADELAVLEALRSIAGDGDEHEQK